MNQDTPTPGGNGKPRKKRRYRIKDPSEYPKLPPPGVLLEDEDVMALLNISINTLRDMCKEGEIPFRMVRNRYKYLSDNILKMLKP